MSGLDDLDNAAKAELRRITEDAVDRALGKAARNLGYESFDDLARNGRKEPATIAPLKHGESDAERRLREIEEAKAKDAEKAAREAAAAESKAERDRIAAERKAELDAVKAEHAAALKAATERAALERRLLAAGVTEDSLDWVAAQHAQALSALPEADREKGLPIKTFLTGVAKRAPMVFAEGRLPKDEPAPAPAAPPSSGPGPLPAPGPAPAAPVKDPRAIPGPQEVQQRLNALKGGAA